MSVKWFDWRYWKYIHIFVHTNIHLSTPFFLGKQKLQNATCYNSYILYILYFCRRNSIPSTTLVFNFVTHTLHNVSYKYIADNCVVQTKYCYIITLLNPKFNHHNPRFQWHREATISPQWHHLQQLQQVDPGLPLQMHHLRGLRPLLQVWDVGGTWPALPAENTQTC